MNDFIEENKKTILLIIVLIAATIIISIASLFVGNKPKMPKPKDAMKELGEIYYEELYHPEFVKAYPNDYSIYLERIQDEGLKVTLIDLLAAIPIASLDVYYDAKGNEICDIYESYVIIKPYSPYSSDDYSLQVFDLCGDKMNNGGSGKNE